MMALPSKIASFAKTIAALNDQPVSQVGGTTQLKAWFDSSPEELRVWISALHDALSSTTDGESGADSIKATAVTGLTGATVQALLEALKAAVDGVALGAIPDASLTEAKLSPTAADNFKNYTDATTGTVYRVVIDNGEVLLRPIV